MNPIDEWALPVQILGRRVLVYDRLDSTNTQALRLAADPAHDGLVILADDQSAGRGQHGRVWQSPPRTSVLLSALVFPPPAIRRPALMTALAAVAVCQTIEQLTHVRTTIKWPNDVLIAGRKVCGILIEQAGGTVIGIGLNVNQPAAHFAASGLPAATSLASASGELRATHDVARLLIATLDRIYVELCAGNTEALEARWREGLGLLGVWVRVETAAAMVDGRLLELNLDSICIEGKRGPVRFVPEAIRHLSAAPENSLGQDC